MTTNQINKIKSEIEQKKQEKSRAEGSIETILKNLEQEYSISSIEEAKEYVKKLTKEVKEDNERLNILIEKLGNLIKLEE